VARFTFTQKFGATPQADDYNSIVDDFTEYINTTKLVADNVADESIRFRHLKRAPTILLFKDCGNQIWSAHASLETRGRSGSWELYRDSATDALNSLQVEYSADEDAPATELVEFTLWYFPYSISEASEVAPAIRVGGVWTPLLEHRRAAGLSVGFYTDGWQAPYTPTPTSHLHHPFLQFAPSGYTGTGTGEYDRQGTVAYGGPVVCTLTLGKGGIGGNALKDIEAYGMMIKHDLSLDNNAPVTHGDGRKRSVCSKYDRLYLSLVARDN
jgi:hypothetical protein